MTYKKPDPGKGWRLLKLGEKKVAGKTYFDADSPEIGWRETGCAGEIYNSFDAGLGMFYRTREGVKPKPYTAKASITVPADYLKEDFKELLELGNSSVMVRAFSHGQYDEVKLSVMVFENTESGTVGKRIDIGDLNQVKMLHEVLGRMIAHAEMPKTGLPFQPASGHRPGGFRVCPRGREEGMKQEGGRKG